MHTIALTLQFGEAAFGLPVECLHCGLVISEITPGSLAHQSHRMAGECFADAMAAGNLEARFMGLCPGGVIVSAWRQGAGGPGLFYDEPGAILGVLLPPQPGLVMLRVWQHAPIGQPCVPPPPSPPPSCTGAVRIRSVHRI